MTLHERDMPAEAVWHNFFDPLTILARLGLNAACRNAADFGCGYGTFTIPAAQIVPGIVYAVDADRRMLAATRKKAKAAGLHNVQTCLRDLALQGSGLSALSVDYVMLFNVLHAGPGAILLSEAHRVLAPGGRLAVLQWRPDAAVPRGGRLGIGLPPERCHALCEQAGFRLLEPGLAELGPYHYGMVLMRWQHAAEECRNPAYCEMFI